MCKQKGMFSYKSVRKYVFQERLSDLTISCLLQKLSVRASNGSNKVLRTVKNPVTNYLPANCRRIGLSRSAPRVVNLRDYVNAASDDEHLVFVVGAMAHGKINVDILMILFQFQSFHLVLHAALVAYVMRWSRNGRSCSSSHAIRALGPRF
ncbi:ribosomal RNA small subunit methyltransferase NEP1-like [Nymphaea colorata]|nr:ribosomal RNA small subunit methyltransferase NEP1-like [Nymphaea colorata]